MGLGMTRPYTYIYIGIKSTCAPKSAYFNGLGASHMYLHSTDT